MRMTGQEQALLTVAIDAYIKNAHVIQPVTHQMWCQLYDAIISADVEDDDAYLEKVENEDVEVEISLGEIDELFHGLFDGMPEEHKNNIAKDMVASMSDNMVPYVLRELNDRIVTAAAATKAAEAATAPVTKIDEAFLKERVHRSVGGMVA